MAKSYCNYCETELEPSREFVYEIESLHFLDHDEWLEEICSVPAYYGEPLRICKKCQASIERNEADRESDEPEEYYGQRGGFQLMAYAVILIAF